MAPPRSNIWKHFKKIAPNTAKCSLCAKVLKTLGNTTNLKTHFKQKHSSVLQHLTEEEKKADEPKKRKGPFQPESRMDVETAGTSSSLPQDEENLIVSQESDDHSSTSTMTVSEYEAEPSTSREITSSLFKQATIVSAFKTISSFKDGGSKNVKLTEALVKFVLQDNLPFNIVEGKGFLSLMKEVAPLYKVPTRNTIKNNIDRKYEVVSAAFKNMLKQSKHLTLTTDIWTADMQTKSFMGLTIHFVHDMKLTSATIGIIELTESHTADYIALELGKALEIWGIDPNNVVAVVPDNAANMVKAIHDKFGKNRHIPCFAHTLNLVCENSLTNTVGLNNIIDKVRSIVVWFKRSVKASDQLRKAQIDAETLEGNIKKLILDVKTRWNSKYYMLERFLQMSPMVSNILLSDVNAPIMITAAEVEHLREVCKYLKPLERMTVEISGENYPTIGKVIPMIRCLMDQYNNYVPRYEIGKELKTTLLKEIEKRFGAIEKSYIPPVSTILDPRFKQIHFRDPQALGTVMRHIKSEITSLQKTSSSSESSDSSAEGPEFDLWAHHKRLANTKKSEQGRSNKDSELNQYLSVPVRNLTDDLLDTWNEMKVVYPNLFKLAAKYFGIVATSVPSERLFSKAGATATKSRNRLKGSRLSKLLFLSSLPDSLHLWN